MPNTPRGYPFPVSTDIAEGWLQIENLARAVDTDVGVLADMPGRAVHPTIRAGYSVWSGTLITDAGALTQLIDLSQGGRFTGGLIWAQAMRYESTEPVHVALTSGPIAAVQFAVRNHLGAPMFSQSVDKVYLAYIAYLAA